MSKQHAYGESIRLAVGRLEQINLVEHCQRLGLPVPDQGTVHFRIFGMNVTLRESDFQILKADSDEPVKPSDRILVLHYLLHEAPLTLAHELVSFRVLPGGQFYWQPFLARTVNPLIRRIGNDLDLLKNHLRRFDWEDVAMGDFGARIHALGKLSITLTYHLGDDEFPPTADVLFDACITQVFPAEDVAVLASRICLGLL